MSFYGIFDVHIVMIKKSVFKEQSLKRITAHFGAYFFLGFSTATDCCVVGPSPLVTRFGLLVDGYWVFGKIAS